MSCACVWAEQQAVGTFRSYRHWPRWSKLPFCSSDRGSSALSITNPSLLGREEMARERNGCDFHSAYGDCSKHLALMSCRCLKPTGDPARTCDRSDASTQRCSCVAFADGSQICPDHLPGGRHRLEPAPLTPGLVVGEIGRIGPQCRRRVGGGLVGMRLGESYRCTCRRRLSAVQAGVLPLAGFVEEAGHTPITTPLDAITTILACYFFGAAQRPSRSFRPGSMLVGSGHSVRCKIQAIARCERLALRYRMCPRPPTDQRMHLWRRLS